MHRKGAKRVQKTTSIMFYSEKILQIALSFLEQESATKSQSMLILIAYKYTVNKVEIILR